MTVAPGAVLGIHRRAGPRRRLRSIKILVYRKRGGD